MREIKLRAWDTTGKRWLTNSEFLKMVVMRSDGLLTFLLESIRIVQFTGLLDKNRQEVYEGDILSCSHDKPITVRNEHVWPHEEFQIKPEDRKQEVYWSDASFKLFDHGMQDWMLLEVAGVGGMEVIGNIYENPDMAPNEKTRRHLKILWR